MVARWITGLAVIGLVVGACSGDDREASGSRSFDLEVTELPAPAGPTGPAMRQEWSSVDAVVIGSPELVTTGEDVDVVVELRNGSDSSLELDPCPAWGAGIGESTENAYATGALPCDDIGSLQPGERIRLHLKMPSPDKVPTAGDGKLVSFYWCVLGGEGQASCMTQDASIVLPIRERT